MDHYLYAACNGARTGASRIATSIARKALVW